MLLHLITLGLESNFRSHYHIQIDSGLAGGWGWVMGALCGKTQDNILCSLYCFRGKVRLSGPALEFSWVLSSFLGLLRSQIVELPLEGVDFIFLRNYFWKIFLETLATFLEKIH